MYGRTDVGQEMAKSLLAPMGQRALVSDSQDTKELRVPTALAHLTGQLITLHQALDVLFGLKPD